MFNVYDTQKSKKPRGFRQLNKNKRVPTKLLPLFEKIIQAAL